MFKTLHSNSNLTQFARQLRNNATREENHLWYDFLRTYPVRFRRQASIGAYIADFYCRDALLVIELDGSQHYSEDGKEYDEARTMAIEQHGIKVLRFTNIEIKKEFEGVCAVIDREVKARIKK